MTMLDEIFKKKLNELHQTMDNPNQNLSMKNTLVLLSLFLFCCRSDKQLEEKINSPSKKYHITTTVNNTDKSRDDYAHLVIHLFNADENLMTSLITKSGDFSKWAVGWHSSNDTVVLYSSDIGSYAWAIERDSLKPISMTEDLKQVASTLKLKKYPENVRDGYGFIMAMIDMEISPTLSPKNFSSN